MQQQLSLKHLGAKKADDISKGKGKGFRFQNKYYKACALGHTVFSCTLHSE
jgi:hypothetical protein